MKCFFKNHRVYFHNLGKNNFLWDLNLRLVPIKRNPWNLFLQFVSIKNFVQNPNNKFCENNFRKSFFP